jgi:hypothetical protein
MDARHLVAYLEVSARSSRPLPALQVHVDVVADSAEPLVRTRADVTGSGRLWARARADVPLESLARGSYVAVARIVDGERELARVSRPFQLR